MGGGGGGYNDSRDDAQPPMISKGTKKIMVIVFVFHNGCRDNIKWKTI